MPGIPLTWWHPGEETGPHGPRWKRGKSWLASRPVPKAREGLKSIVGMVQFTRAGVSWSVLSGISLGKYGGKLAMVLKEVAAMWLL